MMGQNPDSMNQAAVRGRWWGIADVLVYVPNVLLALAFWIWAITGKPYALNQFFLGSRNTAETHIGWVISASLLVALYTVTLFLRGRLLFGKVGRHATVGCAIMLEFFAVITGLVAMISITGAFM
jgi:hypothetical protein